MSQRVHTSRTMHIMRLLKAAITGEEKEYTSGSIDKAIFMLSVPMILEMAMESLFAIVDMFFVSKISREAVVPVGLTESLLMVIYSIAWGMSMGATAVVARRTGEKDADGAAHAGSQAIYAGIGISLILGIIGIIFAKKLLLLMGASEAIANENAIYAQIMLGSNLVIIMLFLINGVFRGAGDASIAMRSLWLANGLNILLCPTLIYGLGPIPALGLKGAAIATTIGRGAGVVYQVYHLVKGKGFIRITRKHLLPDATIMVNVLKMAAGGTAQFLVPTIAWGALVRIIALFGDGAIAGYTIGIRIIAFTIMPAWGMANAAATLVGQNLGAQQPDRAEKSVWRSAFLNMLFLCSIAVIFFIFAEPLVMLFNTEAEVVKYGVECLRYVCMGYMFYGYGMVISQAFNGAGDTRTPTILNIAGFWAFQIPLAYCLAIVFNLGPKGVFSAIAIAESAMAIAAIVLFRQGKWKKVKV